MAIHMFHEAKSADVINEHCVIVYLIQLFARCFIDQIHADFIFVT